MGQALQKANHIRRKMIACPQQNNKLCVPRSIRHTLLLPARSYRHRHRRQLGTESGRRSKMSEVHTPTIADTQSYYVAMIIIIIIIVIALPGAKCKQELVFLMFVPDPVTGPVPLTLRTRNH